LEQTGIIKGYSAIIDPTALGPSITAFISARHPGIVQKETEKALRDLANRDEILEIHTVAGEDCFLIKVRLANIEELNEIIKNLKKPPLMMSTKTTIALETFFEKVGGTILKTD
jgi:Lrp/AsnC family leucine-responsive transcriptional regulator